MTEVVVPAEQKAKINLLNFDHKMMRDYFESIGEKPFRADQMMKWIYHFGYDDFEKMTNLNKKILLPGAVRGGSLPGRAWDPQVKGFAVPAINKTHGYDYKMLIDNYKM